MISEVVKCVKPACTGSITAVVKVKRHKCCVYCVTVQIALSKIGNFDTTLNPFLMATKSILLNEFGF